MTKFEKRILLGLGILILVLSLMEAAVPRPTDWSPSYSRYHARPLGASLVHERLKDLFPEVTVTHDAINARARDAEDAPHRPVNRIFVNDHLRFEPEAAELLLRDAHQGDHILVAAEQISGVFADSLHLAMDKVFSFAQADTGDIRFMGKDRIAEGVFRYVRGTSGAHFTGYDTARTRVLAVDGSARPVLLETACGNGRLVLCSTPKAFTNFNLLKQRNATFMAGAFSVLPAWPVVWDEFYKAGRTESSTPLRYILSQPPLRWAWFLALALVVLYILIRARREQRAIPIVAPPRNATRDLVHTIGRLYWHKGDHADLARKMIAHFKEDVRQRTYLRTFAFDDATVAHLAAKTGLDKEGTAARLADIARYETTARITEQELLRLSNELHAFRQLIR